MKHLGLWKVETSVNMGLWEESPLTCRAEPFRRRGLPLVWAVHGLVKVSRPSRAFPWFMFQQKGVISFVLGCHVIVNYVLKIVVGGIY